MFPNHTWISSDDIRQSLMGDKYDGSRSNEVWDLWYLTLETSLKDGKNVIADATNLSNHHRRSLREMADDCAASIHAIIFRNIGQAVYRNQARKGTVQGDQRVPDSAMISFVMLYEKMLVDIETETYNSVTYIERT
jgi:predicted kinase